MNQKNFLIAVIILLSILFFSQVKLVNHRILDNDEGVYLTTYLLIDAGHPPYTETFLSQPPGFLLTTYPGFIVFGKTLAAARLTIALWSFIGLVALIWVGVELGSVWVGLIAISILYLIPSYFNQTITFQSDSLISTFSLISLASMFRFARINILRWFMIAAFFVNLAFWTKFDLSLIPSFLLILFYVYREKKNIIQGILFLLTIFLIISSLFFLIFISPFGIGAVIDNVVRLRLQASATTPFSFSALLQYLGRDIILCGVIVASIFFVFTKKTSFRYPQIAILAWTFSATLLLFLYRPLFPHHLSILAVPVSLFFSYCLFETLKKNKTLPYGILFILAAVTLYRLYVSVITPATILTQEQQKAVMIIQENTRVNDIVVSDEAILQSMSGRLPPPQLSDISYVRISSNNLSKQAFKQAIANYKPTLIIAWNGRLRSIASFNAVIKDYKPLATFGNSKTIYIRLKMY